MLWLSREPAAPLASYVSMLWYAEGARFTRHFLRFHRDLEADHPYMSAAATWPLLVRPVAYHWEDCPPDEDPAECLVAPGHVAEILAKGNPVLWWLTLLALPLLAWLAARERDAASWLLLAFIAAQYVPWLLAARPLFLFYMVPVSPFMALGLGYAAWRVGQPRRLRWLPVSIAVAAAAAFLYWYPLYAAVEIPRPAWEQRVWFDSWI
jgi:dolichyl-phosphate-mannose-protein mannosyltransferase